VTGIGRHAVNSAGFGKAGHGTFVCIQHPGSPIETNMNDLPHRARYEARLNRVLDHIYDHLDEPLDIDRLMR
jgi:AraC family transcriptional regulator